MLTLDERGSGDDRQLNAGLPLQTTLGAKARLAALVPFSIESEFSTFAGILKAQAIYSTPPHATYPSYCITAIDVDR